MCEGASALAFAQLIQGMVTKDLVGAKPPKPAAAPGAAPAATTTTRRTGAPAGGYGSTLLTGPSGVSSGTTPIGTNKLLGQ